MVVRMASSLPSTTVLYFYCRYNDPQRNNFVAMACWFLQELLRRDDALITQLYVASTKCGESSLRTHKLASDLLNISLKAIGSKLIVLDGLDECPPEEQKRIALWLRKHIDSVANEPELSKCVIFSQNDATIRSYLAKVPELSITSKDNKADIEAYSSVRAKDIQGKFDLADDLTKNITDQTVKKADGTCLSSSCRSQADKAQACFFSRVSSWTIFSAKRIVRVWRGRCVQTSFPQA